MSMCLVSAYDPSIWLMNISWLPLASAVLPAGCQLNQLMVYTMCTYAAAVSLSSMYVVFQRCVCRPPPRLSCIETGTKTQAANTSPTR